MKIKKIILILHSRDCRYYGFRYIRTSDGKMVEAQTKGGESNILHGLTHNGKMWETGYFYTFKQITEFKLFALPYAGCAPEELREWVRKELRKK